jgi:dienelactone hydrolase
MVARTWTFAGTFVVLMGASSFAEAADRSFAAEGTLDVKVEKVPQSTTQIARPTAAGSYPLVVASHGFSASGENQLGWAKHFASWGFVVAVPSFASSFSPDHQANAKVIVDLVAELKGTGTKVGLEGHSAGGLSTALAAVDVKPDAVVLFDPVDNADLGKTATPKIEAPVLGIFAAPSSCNNQAAWKPFIDGSKGAVLAFDVTGSTHCDGENAPRALCGFACGGGADEGRQAAYAHYATAFLLANLGGDAKAKAALDDAEKDGELAGVIRTKTAAPATPDASALGASSSSGGSSTTVPSGSSNTATPTGEGASTDTPVTTSDGGGCATQGQSGERGVLFGLACVAVGVLVRRRRRHARG